MLAYLPKILLLLNPLILAVAITYAYGTIARKTRNRRRLNAAMGCIMGIATVIAMLSPLEFADGVMIDIRSLIVGISAAFFGILGFVIAGGMAIAMRLDIGGAGMIAGVAGIIISGCAGLIWARYVKPRTATQVGRLAILGGMISTHIVAAILLPTPVAVAFMTTLAPVLLFSNLLGAVTVGWMIDREDKLIKTSRDFETAARIDPLTNLLNRRSAVEAFTNIQKDMDSNRGTAMLCIDIDDFKKVNDRHGHLVGDQVLLSVTDRIGKCLRPDDIFSRLGGDEFLIVLPNVSKDETIAIAERCRLSIAADPVGDPAQDVAVSISIGANWARRSMDFTTLLSETDVALYQAKTLGRDCVAYAFQNAAPPVADRSPGAVAAQ